MMSGWIRFDRPLVALFLLAAAFVCLIGPAHAVVMVTTSTTTQTFDTAPLATEWSTYSIGGGSGDITTVADMDAKVQLLTSATINGALTANGGAPGTNATARWNSPGQLLETAPTGNAAAVLMTTLQNNTGGAVSTLDVGYTFGITNTPGGESLPGHEVYYSLTGLANSWTRISALSSQPVGSLSTSLNVGPWASGANLYLLWADDNAATNPDGIYTIDNFSVKGTLLTVHNWTGASTTTPTLWSDIANWDPTGVPGGAGKSVAFGSISGKGAVVLDLDRTVGSIGFNATQPTTIGGTNRLTLDNSGGAATLQVDGAAAHAIQTPVTLANGVNVVVSDAAGSLTLGGVIDGVGPMTKTGSGVLTLGAGNTYTGGTTISAGTLALSAAGTLGSGNVSVSGGVLDVSAHGSGGYTFSSGTFTAGPTGAAGTDLKGVLNVESATLNVTGANALSGASLIVKSGATANMTLANAANGATFTVNTGGLLTTPLGTTNAYSGATINLNGGTVKAGRNTFEGSYLVGGNFVVQANSELNTYNSTVAGGDGTYNLVHQFGTLDFAAADPAIHPQGYQLNITDTGITWNFGPNGVRSRFTGSIIGNSGGVRVTVGARAAADGRGTPTLEFENTAIRAGKTVTVTPAYTSDGKSAASLIGSLGVGTLGGAEVLASDKFTMFSFPPSGSGAYEMLLTDASTFDTTSGLWTKSSETTGAASTITATLSAPLGSIAVNENTSFSAATVGNVVLNGLEADKLYRLRLSLENSGNLAAVMAQLAKNPGYSNIVAGGAGQVDLNFFAPANTGYFAWDNVHTSLSGSANWYLGDNLTGVGLMPVPPSTWTSAADSSWNSAANWDNGAPQSIGYQALFGSGAQTNVQLGSASPTLSYLTFSSAGYTIAQGSGSGSITMRNNGSLAAIVAVTAGNHEISAPLTLGSNTSFSVAAGQQLTISGPVGGAGSLTTTDAGTLVLSGSNSYAGATNVNAGTLQLNGSLTGPGGPVAVPTGGVLNVSAASSVARDATISGGTLNLAGTVAGVLTVTGGSVTTSAGAPTVATADFSKPGTGTVTANTPLAITNQIKLPGGTTATFSQGVSSATSFTAKGANLADSTNTTPRTLSLSGGSLALSAPPPGPTISASRAFWLDANNPATLLKAGGATASSGDAITQWTNADNATQWMVNNGTGPVLTANAFGSLPGVFVGAGNSDSAFISNNGAYSNMASGLTAFYVLKTPAGANQDGYGRMTSMTTSGQSDYGYGGGACVLIHSNGTTNGIGSYQNGDLSSGSSVTEDRTFIATSEFNQGGAISNGPGANTRYVYYRDSAGATSGSREAANENFNSTWFTVGGRYDSRGWGEYWRGYVGEVIIYNAALNDTDRAAVENYLYEKWVNGVVGTGSVDLPSTTIAATASSTLDLGTAGGAHTLASLNLTAGSTSTDLTLANGASLTLNGDANNNAISATGSVGQFASITSGANAPSLAIAAGKNVSVDSGVTLTVQPAIGGASAVSKIGDGTLKLAGVNTYTGATTISAGKLLLAQGGSMGDTAVAVAAGGTYGMAATANGALGASVQGGTTLNINGGALDLVDGYTNTLRFTTAGSALTGASLKFDLGSLTSDKLELNGDVTVGSGNKLYFDLASGGALALGNRYSLLSTANGGLLGGQFELGTSMLGGYRLSLGQDALSVWVDVLANAGNYWAPTASGGTGTWSTATNNWAGSPGVVGTSPQATDSALVFGGTAGTVTIAGGGVAAAGLQFDTAGYVVTGDALTLTAPATVAANQDATISAVVAGTAGLTKSGTGSLLLTAANTYSGATVVNGGKLEVRSVGGSLSSISNTSGVQVATGANVTFNLADAVTFGKAISGAGSLTKEGVGSLMLSNLGLTGVTTVKAGTLELGIDAQYPIVYGAATTDIQHGKLIFDEGDATTIQALLTASYKASAGKWQGGKFLSTTAPDTGLTLGWKQDATSGNVTVMPTFAGDANLDGSVDGIDLDVWKANVGSSTATFAMADLNYDGSVDGLDLDLWKATVGSSGAGGSAASAPVPEPGTLALLAVGLVGLLAWRRRK